MSCALEIEGLWVHARGAGREHAIVRGASLQLAAGTCLTLLGESGSGKSILAHAIMGTLPGNLHTEGRIRLAGTQVLTGDAHIAAARGLWGRQLAMLPQEPWLSLNPTMALQAQVAEVPHFLHRLGWSHANQLARSALDTLGLGQTTRPFAHQISGGMAQRVAFAATRATGAALLIADEPTKGLDVTLRDRIGELLVQHVRAGADNALLTITHDVELAAQLGGYIAVMQDGSIVEQGPAADLLKNPRHAYTRALIAAVPSRWPTLISPLPVDAQPVLTVDKLAKGFGETRLFQNLSFGMREGEVVAVTGPSGCGKTTLGHMVIGIETASEGSVHWHSPTRACQRQKLYQDPPAAFAPRRLLRMAIQDLINRHRLDWTQVHELMTELSLAPALLDRLPTEVSGGELQRLALIRVLLLQPSLVFADEPTSRLDPLLQQQTMRLIVDYAQRHRFGVLLVTHDPDLAARSAHHTLSGLFDNASPEGP